MLQFLEHLSDRQAADAVRARIDWKYALGLELTDPGFHFSVLTEFRARLVVGNAEHLLLDRMLERFKARGLVKARGKQRTDSTHVLAAVHDLSLLELVAETLRAALDDLAAIAPDWLRAVARPVWFERYGRRIEEYRLPRGQDKRVALALEDPAWLERYQRRAGVEGTLSQGVRSFGMRRSRYVGLGKTSLQQVCTAAAMNVSRMAHWLNGRPHARTRMTRFAALTSAA